MCIRDRAKRENEEFERRFMFNAKRVLPPETYQAIMVTTQACLLYTSDAADERSSVDLGGRRIIKKKKTVEDNVGRQLTTNTLTHNEQV